MKFLFTVILSVIVMGHVNASTDIRSQFYAAIDSDRLEEAVALYKQDRNFYYEELVYVIENKQPDFCGQIY